MEEKIAEIRRAGDSAGAIIECVIDGIPAGLGEPVFDKLDAELAKAMLSIGAVKGIEFGEGFNSAKMTGSTWNDKMGVSEDGKVIFETNHAGGILGGISNGNQIIFRLAVKPVPSIFISQKTVNKAGENIDLTIQGRHDVCLAPRIVTVVEAMAAITLLDLFLQQKAIS
jgi:chorismate synthase